MILEAAAAITFLAWLYLLLGRGGFWRFTEPRRDHRLPAVLPRIAAIVPARQEAAVIGRSITSLLKQQYDGPFRVYLVNDHSTDGTVETAANAAAEARCSELLRVVHARPLPPGWSGKVWALAEGIAAATAEFEPDALLLTDADIVHPPDNLAVLVARASAGACDLVSLMAKLQCQTFAEKALIPAFVFFFFKLYPPAWTNDARRSTAGAAGGCILLRSSSLSSIGGIASIRGRIIDDCALAGRLKLAGGSICIGLCRATRSIRGYGTFRSIGQMVARSAFAQLNHSALLLAATIAGMVALYLMPLVLLAAARPVPALLGAVSWGMMSVAYLPAVRFYDRSFLWALTLPLAALFYTGATIHSAVRYWTGRGGAWKGRTQDAA